MGYLTKNDIENLKDLASGLHDDFMEEIQEQASNFTFDKSDSKNFDEFEAIVKASEIISKEIKKFL